MEKPNASGATSAHSEEIAEINVRLDVGDARMGRIEEDLAANTAATQQTAANTAELVDLFNSFKGAIRVFEYIGRLAKPLGYIAGAAASFAALWAAWKSGAHPK